MPTEFDPRDTNKDGKVGPLEAAAARGNIFAKGLNKVADFATVDDPNSQQVKNAAEAMGGHTTGGGTINTNAEVLKDTDAGKKVVNAEAVDAANKDLVGSSETKDALAGAEKAGDEELGEVGTSSGKAPGSSETVEEAKKDPESRYKLKSIFQAYADGDIDKSTRNYLIADTLGTFARNMGKDIGNVAAAYTGGTVNNERDTSIWDTRNQEMASSAIESEKTGVKGSDANFKARMNELQIKAQNLANWNVEDSRKLADMVESTLYDKNGNLRYKPDSKTFKDLTQQIQALRSGGSVNNSMINQLFQWIGHGVGF